jgi:hypothetical protein
MDRTCSEYEVARAQHWLHLTARSRAIGGALLSEFVWYWHARGTSRAAGELSLGRTN